MECCHCFDVLSLQGQGPALFQLCGSLAWQDVPRRGTSCLVCVVYICISGHGNYRDGDVRRRTTWKASQDRQNCIGIKEGRSYDCPKGREHDIVGITSNNYILVSYVDSGSLLDSQTSDTPKPGMSSKIVWRTT